MSATWPCSECGLVVAWEYTGKHKRWHSRERAQRRLMELAIADLIDVIYRDDPDAGEEVKKDFQSTVESAE